MLLFSRALYSHAWSSKIQYHKSLQCEAAVEEIYINFQYFTLFDIAVVNAGHWRRNEFESGGTRPARSTGNNFCRAPSSRLQLAVLVSAFVMVSTIWFLICCFSTHGAPVPSHL